MSASRGSRTTTAGTRMVNRLFEPIAADAEGVDPQRLRVRAAATQSGWRAQPQGRRERSLAAQSSPISSPAASQ